MSDDKTMYELHKVDESTGRHAAILMGVLGDMSPALVDKAAVDASLAMARKHGARPIEEFEDGRVQLGHYMYVPVKNETEGDER